MKRIPMALSLTPQETSGGWSAQTVTPEEAQDLAVLLYAAYRGTIDDDGETFADAQAEIAKTFSGAYGQFLPEASFLIREGEFILSACLISWYESTQSPFIVFMMTRPEYKGRGMGRVLLQFSMNKLIEMGYSKLSLIVTDGNAHAQQLYQNLGFEPMEES